MYPQWRWGYEFSNTISKIWVPLSMTSIVVFFIYYLEKKKDNFIVKNEKYVLLFVLIIGFLFQISFLYYSRGGLLVLVKRLLLPYVSGYFTTAVSIENVLLFLQKFHINSSTYPNFAQWHPPGSVLTFWFINTIFTNLKFLHPIINSISPTHADVKLMWMSLTSGQKLGVLFSGYFLIFLSCLTSIPIYYIGKILYSVRVGFRTAIYYMLIPGIVMFAPLNDIYFPFFITSAFLFYILGVKKRIAFILILSGFLFFLGIFSTLSAVVFLCIFLYFF